MLVTTGDVATILEDKYKIMELFFGMHQQEIADALADSAAGALENLLAGAPPNANPFGTAEGKIHDLFVKFLDNEELAGRDGIPTEAALKGVNHRLKISRGERRPSFIDTGLYQSSMLAWMEDR
ncbi:hypothetical protein FCN80_24145 [Martelella alba]|uniref:Uncharacterized protein n=2 Tax=Martelella alba TaxID=2590451 RepID=A0ABY2SF18_9HYPH|nr:hypothetical protein FCN80_24145 [Martelella alba]